MTKMETSHDDAQRAFMKMASAVPTNENRQKRAHPDSNNALDNALLHSLQQQQQQQDGKDSKAGSNPGSPALQESGCGSTISDTSVPSPAADCPVASQGISYDFKGVSGCPVVGSLNPENQMQPSPNEPLPGQSKPLGTWRQNSSIPSGKDPVWVYPSEQMFYNAMKRKGWSPKEDDMPAVVAIHNAVNERAWREILRWEKMSGTSSEYNEPKLVRFRGRPKEMSPKARFLNFLGYPAPFDRHDWVVDRCGEEVRYVIDFYNAASENAPAAVHLDVRPALDSPKALWERLSMQWRWFKSGRWRQE